jgi:hypothetical protein
MPPSTSGVHSQEIGVGLYAKSEHFVRRPRGVAQSHRYRTVPAPEFQLARTQIEIDLHKSRYEKLPSEKCPEPKCSGGHQSTPGKTQGYLLCILPLVHQHTRSEPSHNPCRILYRSKPAKRITSHANLMTLSLQFVLYLYVL